MATRPIQYYGTASVVPVAPALDAHTARDRVIVTYGEFASKRFAGEDAYFNACRFAESVGQ